MSISYKKLWKLLIETDIKKRDLQIAVGISSSSITKMGKNENVNVKTLAKICKALTCNISDIVEIIDDNSND